MFTLYNKDDTCVASFSTMSEAKEKMLYLYIAKELPRLAKVLSVDDYLQMVNADRETAFAHGYIEDFMTIKEE